MQIEVDAGRSREADMREALFCLERRGQQAGIVSKIPNTPFPAINGVADFIKIRECVGGFENVVEHFSPGFRA